MANQPPARPWFRLASLRTIPPAPAPAPAPAPPPAPAPQPETRPPVARTTFRTSSAPSSPQTRPAPPAPETRPPPPAQEQPPPPETRPPVIMRPTFRTSSAPSSPITRPPPPPPEEPIAPPPPPPPAPAPERRSLPPSPVQKFPSPAEKSHSPKTIRPAPESPEKVHPISAPPPSPLVLPPRAMNETEAPAETEAEQKRVMFQKTVEKPKQKMNSEKGSFFNHEKHGGHRDMMKKTEESSMKVITIAGENKGAFMEVIQSPNKHNNKKKGIKLGSESEKSSGEEEEGKKKGKGKKGKSPSSSSWPMTAFLNSNVQSVNNSLMYSSSCSQHDPGVRFVLTKKLVGDDGFDEKKEHKN